MKIERRKKRNTTIFNASEGGDQLLFNNNSELEHKREHQSNAKRIEFPPIDKVIINQSHRRRLLFIGGSGEKNQIKFKMSIYFFLFVFFSFSFLTSIFIYIITHTHNQNRFNNKHRNIGPEPNGCLLCSQFFSSVFVYINFFFFFSKLVKGFRFGTRVFCWFRSIIDFNKIYGNFFDFWFVCYMKLNINPLDWSEYQEWRLEEHRE